MGRGKRIRLGEADGGQGVARTADIDGVRDVLRLAVVEGLELGELNTVLLHQVREAEEHVAAVARVALLEGLEGLGRGGDGVIDVLLAGRLDGGDHLLGRRVDGVELHGAVVSGPARTEQALRRCPRGAVAARTLVPLFASTNSLLMNS